jgi:putative ABC transport system permease protein
MNALIQDVKYALRTMGKNPGFTAVALVTLALGIGANTAMFSVVYGVLLSPLPYPEPESIIRISGILRGEPLEAGFTADAFDYWKQHRDPFESIAASVGLGFNLVGAGRAERIQALRVSPEFFSVFGVRPLLGRSFTADDDHAGGPNVAVLNFSLWKEHFNGDNSAIGRSVSLDGVPYTVIGVMPRGFASIPPADLWTTLEPVRRTMGSGMNYQAIARLKPGVSPRQASSFLGALSQPFAEENYRWMKAQSRKTLIFWAAPLRYAVSRDARQPLLVLFAAIGFVLLIACVNVANLLLARTAGRGREIALRNALGAGRARILRQVLTESVLLATLGGALGLAVAYLGLGYLLSLAPDVLPRAENIELNFWALLFTASAALLTGILFGITPAFQAAGTGVNETLKESEGRASLGLHRRRLSAAMVSAEVALSLILLIGSGLLIRTFIGLLSTDPGFNPRNMLALQIWTTGSKYNSTPALHAFYQEVQQRITAIPGVQSASVVAAGLPLERGINLNPGVMVNGHEENPSVDYREITPEYIQTLGVPLLSGRNFQLADSHEASKVAMINAEFAREYFKDQNPVGKTLTLGKDQLEIVGVLGDVRSSLDEQAPPTFFVPIAQASFVTDQALQAWSPTSILVRTAVNPLSLSHAVQAAVQDADPNIPIGHVRSMEEVLAVSLALQRLLMALMSVFAGLALLLAAVGIYGVLSYAVRQRTREIGIRLAMGAQRYDVLRLVVGQGFRLAVAGLIIGVAGALVLTHYLSSLLFGVKPNDPLTFVAVSALLLLVAMLAAYVPALRATKVDPIVALRHE